MFKLPNKIYTMAVAQDSMVTSFQPKLSLVRAETVLTRVRPVSNVAELYTRFTEYRMEALEERLRDRLGKKRHRQLVKRPFDIVGVKTFLMEQRVYLKVTIAERIG